MLSFGSGDSEERKWENRMRKRPSQKHPTLHFESFDETADYKRQVSRNLFLALLLILLLIHPRSSLALRCK
jgi:hypothetical protein